MSSVTYYTSCSRSGTLTIYSDGVGGPFQARQLNLLGCEWSGLFDKIGRGSFGFCGERASFHESPVEGPTSSGEHCCS
jgi:hypothetical protein